ncbi:MAG: ATPase, T2SS/T4P/T4SS family [Candidatus Gastranaerophilales bacterium]|nr:ATPase, T2SS/T4P/T4SS family [Candidatus Gastranaerophilales bacterium]
MQELLTNKTIEKLKYDLVRDGLINYDDLSKAEETAETMSVNLAQILIQMNLISEDCLLSFIEAKLHIPYVNLDDYTLDKKCLQYILRNDAKKYRIIPLFKIEEVLTIAMADPLDLFFINNLIDSINLKLEPVICSERSILEAIDNNYDNEEAEINDFGLTVSDEFDWQEELNDEIHDEFQAQRIVQAILYQAVTENASEIFLEHIPNGIGIKFKKDHEIFYKGNIPILLVPLCSSRLKIISNLDPAVSEIPQLGKLKFFVDPLKIIASVSAFPTIKGERISIKLYKPPKKFDEIFTNVDNLDLLKAGLTKPGIVLVCGSNLSGKTSNIYSILSSLDSKNKNIMTIESIVKYDLPDINQCELNERIGFDLNKALKFIDFQSPEIIYIEEFFNKDGLDIITALAQSGKLVISEFLADNLNVLNERLKELGSKYIKRLISCIIFIHSRDNIEILSKDELD